MPNLLALVIIVAFFTACAVVFVWFLVDVFRFTWRIIRALVKLAHNIRAYGELQDPGPMPPPS